MIFKVLVVFEVFLWSFIGKPLQLALNMCENYFLLEQSVPFLPELHEHLPVAESHIPSPLQLFGQDNG